MSTVFSATLPDVEIPQSDGEHTVKASTSKFVLLALADHANDEGRGAYPSLDTLSKKTSMSRRTVQRALDALIKLEIIKCVGVSEYGTDNYTIYEAAISGGVPESSPHQRVTLVQGGVTLVQEEGDSGAEKCVPESPESSFKPSFKPSIEPVSKPEIDYWNTLIEIINADRDIPPASKRRISAGVPSAYSDGVLTINHPEPDWANSRFSRTMTNLFQGLQPGGAVRFTDRVSVKG